MAHLIGAASLGNQLGGFALRNFHAAEIPPLRIGLGFG